MSRMNAAGLQIVGSTHEGADAAAISPLQELRRSVLTALLWENIAYESGGSVALRIASLIPKVDPKDVAALAIEAREQMKLRHVPLFLCVQMAKHQTHRPLVRETLARVIQRPDELAEILSLYWGRADRKQLERKGPVARSVLKGLADAFHKFSEYSLSKYNQDNPIKLRDVLFLAHPKPIGKDEAALWQRVANQQLATPDTWEVAISACGSDVEKKHAEWTRLLTENRLGAMALIRNLRNMLEANVDDAAIRQALRDAKADKVLPFRFLTAARIAPRFVQELEQCMLRNLEGNEKLPGHTIVLVDVSGSMTYWLSAKSDAIRMDAAAGLAVLLREICQSVRIFTFSNGTVEVPAYRGLGLVGAIKNSQPNQSTRLGNAVDTVNREQYDRLIVITDEQSQDKVAGPKGKGYLINISVEAHGVGYRAWQHIDGWSEHVLDYIRAVEV